jgi:hypothetical protein
MSQATTGKRRNRATNSYSVRDRDGNRRREERYLLIAEIAASKKQTESYMEFAYGSNWDDR